MNRIFLFLAVTANLALLVTFAVGWTIEDPSSLAVEVRQRVSLHFLLALASVTLALLVHAIVLTYFMGTGRWIEETCSAYRFEEAARRENIRLKYRVIPGMMICMGLLIGTGALGAIADPASNMQIASAANWHLMLAVATLAANVWVSVVQYDQITRNSALVDQVYKDVQAARRARGLDDAPPSPEPDRDANR